MKTHVKRSVCFFLCLIFVLFLVVSEALAMVSETDVSVVMDTWEIVPALEDPFGKWFPWLVEPGEEYIQDWGYVSIPWPREENIGVWVSGWIFADSEAIYHIYEKKLQNGGQDVIMTSYIFAENIETVGYVYSDRCRISIYFPVRDTGMDDAEVETLLRNLDIDAKIVKMDYNQDEAGHYETKIDMSGITKRAFDKGPAVYTQITSCERLEDYSPYDSPIKWRWPELAKWGISFLTGR